MVPTAHGRGKLGEITVVVRRRIYYRRHSRVLLLQTTCESHFVILALQKHTNSYLYAKLPGLAMPDSSHAVPNNSQHVPCPTNNRFIVHAGDTRHAVVCPDPYYTVEV